jgi:prepilin-type N-terminal cleavage/methylation domain-containing protein
MSTLAAPRGFTLVETLVATGILVTALAGVAHLFILSTHLTRQANTAGAALVAAQDKLETLAAAPFDYGSSGATITDPALEPSPESSLDEDVEPYVDWIDAAGEPRASADDAVFVRRWRVLSIGTGVPESVAVEVCVFRMPANGAAAASADACLSTVRTRQP